MRGWLTEQHSPLFHSSLRYDETTLGTDGLYSGNIAEWEWNNTWPKKRDNRFYKKQFREYAAFDSNSIAYENSIEIEGSRENRQKAIDIISKDNGNGGTRDENNREYGGHFTKEGVREVEAGPVAKPGDKYVSVTLLFPNHTFHSHPSGDNTGGFLQFPSKTDLDITGETISYVFGRGNNTTYIFNSSGVLATIPTSRFVDFKRPKK